MFHVTWYTSFDCFFVHSSVDMASHPVGTAHVPVYMLIISRVCLCMIRRYLPLWLLVLGQSCALGTAFYNVSDHDAPPTQRWIHFSLMGLAFVTSIAWISIFANELLGCLNAIGMIMGISPTILGVTVRSHCPTRLTASLHCLISGQVVYAVNPSNSVLRQFHIRSQAQ